MDMKIGSMSGLDMTSLYQDLFKKVDENGDGKVDKTEFGNAVSSMAGNLNVNTEEADAAFAKLDESGDGTVDSSEMMAALKAMGDQMRAQMPPPPPPPDSRNETLTDDQKTTVSSILSNYDASNLTAEDAKAINQAFQDAGIPFGKALGDAMEAEGFSVQTMMSLAPPPDRGIPADSGDSQDVASAQGAMFSDLLKSLSETDAASTNAMFSDLVSFLQSSDESSDDTVAALINKFIEELQTNTQYGAQGNVSVSSVVTQNVISLYA